MFLGTFFNLHIIDPSHFLTKNPLFREPAPLQFNIHREALFFSKLSCLFQNKVLMSFPREEKEAVLGKDWNADLLHLFESGELYDCTFKVGRDDLESGCKVCNNYYVTTAVE
jgi:hypothetical protein